MNQQPPSPLAYVSDENYLALHDVALEFIAPNGFVHLARSSPSGAVYADLPPGQYRVTLAKEGFGPKTVTANLAPDRPFQFRLLSNTLYGYIWPKWTQSASTGDFRVHSPEPYHISLWRYGKEKQLIHPIGWFDEHGPRANLQLLPDNDFTQTGVAWKNLNNSRIVAPPRSGLYVLHVQTASGRFLSFPWVVAPAKPSAKIAVIASTNTWNAYNNFGGRSNYVNANSLPPQPTVNSRQDLARYNGTIKSVWQFPDDDYLPLSFDRPEPFNHIDQATQLTDPIRGRQACHLAEAEWKLLGWLEREGFTYDLYSDHQLHAGVLDLDACDVVVLNTHPEYWSRQQYQRLKDWVFDRAGKLMYLGGNGIDCEIEFPSDSTMRCKTWLPVPAGVPFVDPQTQQHYDCRFHHKVESPAALLGVVFTESGCATSAPYRCLNSRHWIFAGTNLKEGDVFGTHSLHERCPGGASGHETDKRTASTPPNAVLLARGMNPSGGGAEMTFYETPTGGAVFSVGSITWPACVLVDQHCSRITRNVLNRFLNKPV